MAAPTTYQGVAEAFGERSGGQLFAGKTFWVAQRVPTRNRFLDDIKANGGTIVVLESKADYRIADHFRKDCPPETISYTFILKSIENGELEDPEDHRCGLRRGEAREPGSMTRPAKSLRAAYTAEEDRMLYKWVKDAEAKGGHASGNEIYKALEAAHPRHTWASWRDRYIKQLRHRPPSAFNVPDNAPPSPPSDRSRQRTPEASTSDQTAQTRIKAEAVDRSEAQLEAEKEYNVEELKELFSSQDWETIYGWVEYIDAVAHQETYATSWKNWAEDQGKQTAAQWRQYYEKVVRPQWMRDPSWKREQIKLKVERRIAEEATPEAEQDTTQKETELSDAHSVVEIPRSSNVEQAAVHHGPEIKTRKRVHEEEMSNQDELARPEPQTKRQRSINREPFHTEQQADQGITRQLPLEMSSGNSSELTSEADVVDERQHNAGPSRQQQVWKSPLGSPEPASDSETMEEQLREQITQDMTRAYEENISQSIESDMAGPDSHIRDTLEIDSGQSSDEETPRAGRHKPTTFDTQAILSSPSQNSLGIGPPPRIGLTQGDQKPRERSSSLSYSESETSITQSLQEFRRSLNDHDIENKRSFGNEDSRGLSISPSPSSASSFGSGDPDPPMNAAELNEFFEERLAEGFSNDFIVKALKRTRCRPDLAVLVLETWREGKPLPIQRGIWSLPEDEAVESGDGVALAQLSLKHTMDGWGGITERLIFLESYRSR